MFILFGQTNLSFADKPNHKVHHCKKGKDGKKHCAKHKRGKKLHHSKHHSVSKGVKKHADNIVTGTENAVSDTAKASGNFIQKTGNVIGDFFKSI
jgi:Mn-containing catalase